MKNIVSFVSYVKENAGVTSWCFTILVALALLFQLGHFGEHIAQAVAWIFGYREAPYMTAFGMWLMGALGHTFFPESTMSFQMMMGGELLHLIGNAIFALGVLGLLYFVRNVFTMTAVVVQLFHLYEHITLTHTAINFGTPIGMSTLWGAPLAAESLVTLRVWWHLSFNAIPTLLTIYVIWTLYKNYKSRYLQTTIDS